MPLRFTKQAFQDLDALDTYLADKSPQGLANVLASLRTTFVMIESNPHSGRPTMRESIRVALEPRYKYVIPYWLDRADVWVLRVYHPRRAPLDVTALQPPESL
jgi:toxin ParE1/3/4